MKQLETAANTRSAPLIPLPKQVVAPFTWIYQWGEGPWIEKAKILRARRFPKWRISRGPDRYLLRKCTFSAESALKKDLAT